MRVSIFRKTHFNAAHRLHNPNWSDEKNIKIYGKCNNYNFHGHNYELEVKLTGEVDPESGYLMDLKVLSDLIKEHVEERFDHKNLNLDCEEFAELPPSTENFSYIIYNIMRKIIDPAMDIKIRLYETPRNYVEYPAD